MLKTMEERMFDEKHVYEAILAEQFLNGKAEGLTEGRMQGLSQGRAEMAEFLRSKGVSESIIAEALAAK